MCFVKFTCIFPYGTNYIKQLRNYLEVMEIPYENDPRRGGSSWGLLISNSEESLNTLLKDIERRMEHGRAYEQALEGCTTDEDYQRVEQEFDIDCDVVDYWWEAEADDVIQIDTCYKRLEIEDHGVQLQRVGIELSVSEGERLSGRPSFNVSFRSI